jgi:hypothetical protein
MTFFLKHDKNHGISYILFRKIATDIATLPSRAGIEFGPAFPVNVREHIRSDTQQEVKHGKEDTGGIRRF